MAEDEFNQSAAYFAKMATKTDSKILRQIHDLSITFTFYNMCVHLLLTSWLEQRKMEGESPQAIIDLLIGAWRKAVNVSVEPMIQQHTEMMQTTLGKLLSDTMGDGEEMRLRNKQELDFVEEQIRNALSPILRQLES